MYVHHIAAPFFQFMHPRPLNTHMHTYVNTCMYVYTLANKLQ